MNFAALLPILLPLITQFLKGKSGDDVSGMLNGNQDVLANLLGNHSPLQGGGESGALSALTLLLPLLMKQNSVVVMSPTGANSNLLTPNGGTLPPPVDLESIHVKLDSQAERIALIEKFIKINNND